MDEMGRAEGRRRPHPTDQRGDPAGTRYSTRYGRYARAQCFCQRRQKYRAVSSPVVYVAACSTLYFQESLSPRSSPLSPLLSPPSPLPSPLSPQFRSPLRPPPTAVRQPPERGTANGVWHAGRLGALPWAAGEGKAASRSLLPLVRSQGRGGARDEDDNAVPDLLLPRLSFQLCPPRFSEALTRVKARGGIACCRSRPPPGRCVEASFRPSHGTPPNLSAQPARPHVPGAGRIVRRLDHGCPSSTATSPLPLSQRPVRARRPARRERPGPLRCWASRMPWVRPAETQFPTPLNTGPIIMAVDLLTASLSQGWTADSRPSPHPRESEGIPGPRPYAAPPWGEHGRRRQEERRSR